jgi:serine/threonine protein kinase
MKKYNIENGGFGCILYPAILCKNKNNKTHKKYISKLLSYDDGEKERYNITKLQKLLKKIPNYSNYFLIDDIISCEMYKDQIKTNLDKCKDVNLSNDLINIVMPYGGISLLEYYNKNLSVKEEIIINNKLIELLLKAILPMNKLHIFHGDIKANNILVSFNNNNINLKLIDWGISQVSKEPIESRPLHINMPFSIILFETEFKESFIDYLNQDVVLNYQLIRTFIINYYTERLSKSISHFNIFNNLIKKLFYEDLINIKNVKEKLYMIYYEYTFYFIIEYLTAIVFHYTKNKVLNLDKYYNAIYSKIVDIWGFFNLFDLLYNKIYNVKTKDKYHHNILFLIKNFYVNEIYTKPLQIINTNKMIETIKEINDNLNKTSTIFYKNELKKNVYRVKLNSTIKNKLNTYSTFILSK